MHIFISYSAKDGTTEARELVGALESAALRCRMAPGNMTPGVEYSAQIVRAIRESHSLVLVLTPGANDSR